MKIEVLGTGCSKCKELERLTREVVAQNGVEAEIEKVEDIMKIISYGVMSTPALVIDQIVMSTGRIPSKTEIMEFVTTNQKK